MRRRAYRTLRISVYGSILLLIASLYAVAADPTTPAQQPASAKAASPAKERQTMAKKIEASVSSTDVMFGAERVLLTVSGYRAFVLKPTHLPRSGTRPWLFYAPTFLGPNPENPEMNPFKAIHPADEHTPIVPPDRPDRANNAWLIKSLLDAGFHVSGIEVGESSGSPMGREKFTDFYQHLIDDFGLDPKVCLYGQSRGGLMLYNWAAEHPDSVLCIGMNQPVCDLATWPGVAPAAKTYGISAEELTANLDQHNPIERLKPIAQQRIPILHVHGSADSLIKIEPHSMELARRYRALGGDIEVIVKENVEHGNWPELLNEPRMLEFFLKHTASALTGRKSPRSPLSVIDRTPNGRTVATDDSVKGNSLLAPIPSPRSGADGYSFL